MWTGKFSRYFMVLLCAYSYNVAWAQEDTKTVRYNFNEYHDSLKGQTPTFTAGGSVPKGVTVSSVTGFAWALSYKYIFTDNNCTDRVVVEKPSDSPNTASISFTGFKYAVKKVEWNVMCDLLAGGIFKDPYVETTISSLQGQEQKGTYTTRVARFTVYNFPNTNEDMKFNGLSSIVINDYFTTDKCRVFLKAGTGKKNYAFQITYYEPSVGFKSSMPSHIKLGQTLDVSQLDTIYHPGAFNFTTTYRSSDTNIFTVDKNSGVITPKNLGKAKIRVIITDGEVVKRDSAEIEVVAPNLGNDQYLVPLKYNDGTENGETVIVTYGQDMPTVTPPTRKGYTFDGYWDNQTNGMGKQYYNKKGSSAAKWDKKWKDILFAHWAPRTYTVTFDLNDESHEAIFPDNVIENNKDRKITITNDGKMKVKFVFGESKDNSIDLSVPKKPGYEMLGWYDDNDELIVTVDNKNRHAYITDKNNYWLMDGNNVKWNYTKNLVLKAKYRCKYTVVDADNGPIIKFDNEIVEPKQDWLSSVISDLQGAAKEVGTKENPVMAFDLRKSTNVWNGNGSYECQLVMESLQGIDYISPNVLVYFNNESYSADKCNNAILIDNTCPNLYVTDRYEIKVPYAFKANNALYERNKNYNDKDAAKAQAANSKWGTLCLPYPIRNNANNVKFYKLAGFEKSVMHYTPMNVDVIPANTPVLYKRLKGAGSEVEIKAVSINVPKNTSYSTNQGSSLDPWKFIGTLTTQIFCGKEYDSKKVPVGAEKMDGSKEIYYFKQDKFTHLSNTGKVTMLPYRAYFTTTAANAKFTTFSIIAIDEEGATDITNLIDNDAEGDGKIYDLNGRRVMQPVSGRLYIVNGQKKVY